MEQIVNRVEEALFEAIAKTMEEMAFEQIVRVKDRVETGSFDVDGRPESGDEEPQAIIGIPEDKNVITRTMEKEKLWAACPLHNPLGGDIIIEIDRDHALKICRSLFGLSEAYPDDEMVFDAISEVMNTIAGCFMKELIPPDREYVIGFPMTDAGPSSSVENAVVEVYYKVGDHIMKAMVTGEDFRDDAALDTARQEVSE